MVIKIRKSGVKSGAFPNPPTQFTKENAAYYPLTEYGKNFQATYFVGFFTNKATLTKLMNQFSILILGVIDAMSEKIEGNEEEIKLKFELFDKMLEMYKVLSR